MKYKDSIYKRRREKVAKMCKLMKQVYPRPVKHDPWIDGLKVVRKQNVALCNIAKVLDNMQSKLSIQTH